MGGGLASNLYDKILYDKILYDFPQLDGVCYGYGEGKIPMTT